MIKVHKAADGKFTQVIEVGDHSLLSDAGVGSGGDGAGPDPHDLLDAALGACTAITVTMVAKRKQLPLTDVRVQVTHTEKDGVYTLHREVEFVGELNAEQREYLLGIANKCPVHKTLAGRIEINTQLL